MSRAAGWIDDLGARSGPLGAAARRFLDTHPGAPDAPLSAGPDGLDRLASAIDGWAEREDADLQADEAFVEGAGALLGLLLVAHLGGGHLTDGADHRVRLGADGFFDPFAAIERALEADEARAALAAEVARAEAEARGEAGVGRAMRLLRARLGDRRVTHAFGARVVLEDPRVDGPVELDLSRVLRATEGQRESAAAQAVDKLVAMLPGREGPGTPWEEAAARIVPRPTAPGFSADLARERRASLAVRPLLGGAVELTFVLAYDGRARYVREAELGGWKRSFDDALAAALRNLAAASERARFARIDTPDGPLVVARTGDGLDGARLLLPSLHEVLAPELGSPFRVAVPHRDALLACAAEPALERALAEQVRRDAARAPHPVSARLFRVTPAGLRAD
ncbi:MAG TPA: hypothetical protein RMH99_32375 [Sandaracinaceae bacterium LLY-WYZ-13_1]|nr:hypothetical protein [Sandaracinaceae bacterium LLY-WYZ-13_1]